jgi:hypothetical protein
MAPHTGGRTAAAQLRELGHPVAGEDTPRWHLAAAEEAMDEGRWDAARVALQRARDNLQPEDLDTIEARFVALRLAVSTVDLRAATDETMALVEGMDEGDPVWNRRVREIIDAAPRVFSSSMRTGLTALLPPAPRAVDARPPAVTDETPEPELFAVEESAQPGQDGGGGADYDVWVDDGESAPEVAEVAEAADEVLTPVDEVFTPEERGPDERWHVRADPGVDVEDADSLRDHLVERMLAEVTDDEFLLLFETATTFLANGQFDTAELIFSAAMQAPALRVAACEGLVQSLVRGGRHSEAITNAVRATRVFAREGDHLAGVLYWQGVAAQESGDPQMARGCFDRVLATPAAAVFPELRSRREAVGA